MVNEAIVHRELLLLIGDSFSSFVSMFLSSPSFFLSLVLSKCHSLSMRFYFQNNLPFLFFFLLSLSLFYSLPSFFVRPPFQKSLSVQSFLSSIYKEEEREPPCPVQSWGQGRVVGAAFMQPPRAAHRAWLPYPFHDGGRPCSMGYVSFLAIGEGEKKGEKHEKKI